MTQEIITITVEAGQMTARRKSRKIAQRRPVPVWAIVKYAALTIAGIMLFREGAARALAYRGYFAVGGEVFALFLPVFYYHLIKQPGGGSTVYGWVNAADVQAVGSGTTAPKMRVGAKVKYSGPLYRDSNGGGKGKTVNGTYTVKYYYTGRKCGVHIDGLGWVPESGCTVIG